MSKTIEEQIKVMQHFANGGEVEYLGLGEDSLWEKDENPNWDWSIFDYRIKEQKKTVTIEKWLMLGDTGCYFVLEGSISYFEGYKNIIKVKLLDTYEVEL